MRKSMERKSERTAILKRKTTLNTRKISIGAGAYPATLQSGGTPSTRCPPGMLEQRSSACRKISKSMSKHQLKCTGKCLEGLSSISDDFCEKSRKMIFLNVQTQNSGSRKRSPKILSRELKLRANSTN